jgi:YD repeat-containing protein
MIANLQLATARIAPENIVHRHGLALVRVEAGWEVRAVSRHSRAGRAGIAPGDVLVTLHRIPLNRSVLGQTLIENWDGYGRLSRITSGGRQVTSWVNLVG